MHHADSTPDSFRIAVSGRHVHFTVPVAGAVQRDLLIELFREKFPASEGWSVIVGQVRVEVVTGWAPDVPG